MDPDSYAATLLSHCGNGCGGSGSGNYNDRLLCVGCEILAVNGHRVKRRGMSSVSQIWNVMLLYLEKHGKVSIKLIYVCIYMSCSCSCSCILCLSEKGKREHM